MNAVPSSRTMFFVALAVLAIAVGLASSAQRQAARSGAAEVETGKRLLESMVEQETGQRGYALSGDDSFLDPYRLGEERYVRDLGRARRQVAGDARAKPVLEAAVEGARRWKSLSDIALYAEQRDRANDAYALGPLRERKAAMDRYRELNARYVAVVRDRAVDLESRAGLIAVGLVVLLGGVFGLVGLALSRRAGNARAAAQASEQAFEERQRELNFGLQVTVSEEEAQSFLRRHLEQSIAGSEVVVLKRNNSANRLLPATELAADSKLTEVLRDAEPRACLAVRLAQRRSHPADQSASVLACGVCGRLGTLTTCSPLLVGGEVIGSVLVGHPAPLDDQGARALDESVKQAAPVLANLRNLAIAETRAATDGLTGLPNRRAFEETLKRMAAHAGRALSPLAAVALDLDHFKDINDVHGHGRGDDVLAGVGALLAGIVRDSDFVARVGGEEFTILLPDTGRDGALVICERIRAAIDALDFPGLGQGVSASLGVAILPEDEVDAVNLVRAADRMLYQAKTNGRNRVEISTPAPEAVPEGEHACPSPAPA